MFVFYEHNLLYLLTFVAYAKKSTFFVKEVFCLTLLSFAKKQIKNRTQSYDF
jgi:hypothetical protein